MEDGSDRECMSPSDSVSPSELSSQCDSVSRCESQSRLNRILTWRVSSVSDSGQGVGVWVGVFVLLTHQ